MCVIAPAGKPRGFLHANIGGIPVCDYSLQAVASMAAEQNQRLVSHDFTTGTNGFSPADSPIGRPRLAVCLLPGTELAFDEPIKLRHFYSPTGFPKDEFEAAQHRTARFRQVDPDIPHTHHDAFETPDGSIVMLHWLVAGQAATVLQLPAKPRNETEAQAQKRVEFVG